jgi:hypothetical protein
MKTVLMAAAVAAMSGTTAPAENIALADPSLEAPFTGVLGTTVSGWNTFGATTAAQDVAPGSFWGGGAGMNNRDGTNAAYTVNIGAIDGGSIYQTVELDAGITYVLTAGIGSSASVNKNTAKYALVFFSDGFGTLHAEKSGVVANQTGGFADDSVSFTPTLSGKYNIGMRNRGYVPGTGANNNESTVFFDNVRLTTPAVVFPPSVDVASNDSVTVRSVNVEISNNSTSSNVAITGIQVTGFDASLFTVVTAASPGTPFQIAANTIGTIELALNPGGISGNIEAPLEITSNHPGSPQLIPIRGLIRDPWIDTVTSVNLPTQLAGSAQNFDVTIKNLGAHDLEISDAFASGTDGSYFTLVTGFVSPLVIAAGSTDTVTFKFDPAGESRTFNANLGFYSNDEIEPTRVLTVMGTSAPAGNIALADPSLEAPFTGVGGTATSGWFTFGGTSAAEIVGPGSFWGGGPGMTGLDGTRAAYAVNLGENDGGSIYQTVELNAGVTYVLTAGIGSSASVNKNTGKYALVFFSDGFGTLHAEKTGVVANQTGGFTNDSVTFTPTVSGKYNIGMRNRGYVPGTGANNNESTIFFDNVRLREGGADFSSWAQGFGIPDDPADDSDFDGIPALTEYGLGYDPTVFSRQPAPVAIAAGFTVTWPKGSQAAADSQITYGVEVSSNLADWEPPAPADLVETAGELILMLPGGAPRSFARVSVVRTQ